MAMQKVEVISNSLALLGQRPITSLANPSSITLSAIQAFDFLVPYMLSTGFWRFATKIVQLALLVPTPPVKDWKYIYQLPTDFLKLVRLYPHNYAYEIYTDSQLYANVNEPLFLEYIFMPDEDNMPFYFNGYLIYKIAEYLALSNAQDVQFSQKLQNDMGVAQGVALAADCQNRPQTPLISQPIISDRAVATLLWG